MLSIIDYTIWGLSLKYQSITEIDMAIKIKVEPGITSCYVFKLHHPMDHECDITNMLRSHALKRR